jgi:aldose sugar dehydrogenase
MYQLTAGRKPLGFVAMASITLFSCARQPANGQPAAGAPVETAAANTRYAPAFAGQTRVKSVATTTAYKAELIASALKRPWAVVPLPDGRLIVTEIKGSLAIFDANGKLQKTVTGLPEVVAKGQGGLLDIAPDPNFLTNRLLYWSYAEAMGEGNLTAVAKGKLSADETTVQDVQVIFRATPALKSNLHFGSRLLFDGEGYLYVTTGERSNLDGRKQSPWLSSGLGKIFKITTQGKPAPGNPFLGRPDAMPEIWSYGHRNPQSLDMHPETGAIWEAEFGPRGGDELNLIAPGKNYGWPTITYGLEYSGQPIGEAIQQKEGLEQPVYYWDPVLSPSGMTFYKGNAIPEWKNNLFIGGLSSMHIARLVIENNKVVGEERLLADKQERFRDVAYLNGALYAVTDNGNMYKIEKK